MYNSIVNVLSQKRLSSVIFHLLSLVFISTIFVQEEKVRPIRKQPLYSLLQRGSTIPIHCIKSSKLHLPDTAGLRYPSFTDVLSISKVHVEEAKSS